MTVITSPTQWTQSQVTLLGVKRKRAESHSNTWGQVHNNSVFGPSLHSPASWLERDLECR